MTASPVHLRRRRYFVLQIADELELNFDRFLRARREGRRFCKCSLLCPLSGNAIDIDPDDLGLAMRIPADAWVDLDEVPVTDERERSRLVDLASRGVLLSDPPAEGWAHLAAGEDALEQAPWNELAAVYHARTRWQGVDVLHPTLPVGNVRLAYQHLRWLRGEPPSPFVERDDADRVTPLRVPKLDDAFFRTLLARRTTRAYRSGEALPIDALEQVLYAVFGTHGLAQLAEGVAALKRTSPSGGALHPIEAYVLVLNVDGVGPGLYHYDTRIHALARLEAMEAADARALAGYFTSGQTFFADAHALVIHVARFRRNFWKYGRDVKAYNTVLMDAGHLSQTFYLCATHLGYGAFYTAAINDADIARRLKLDPLRESPIGINGIGIIEPGRDDLHLPAEPYHPVRMDSTAMR